VYVVLLWIIKLALFALHLPFIKPLSLQNVKFANILCNIIHFKNDYFSYNQHHKLVATLNNGYPHGKNLY
jgi:hypothetical protein